VLRRHVLMRIVLVLVLWEAQAEDEYGDKDQFHTSRFEGQASLNRAAGQPPKNSFSVLVQSKTGSRHLCLYAHDTTDPNAVPDSSSTSSQLSNGGSRPKIGNQTTAETPRRRGKQESRCWNFCLTTRMIEERWTTLKCWKTTLVKPLTDVCSDRKSSASQHLCVGFAAAFGLWHSRI